MTARTRPITVKELGALAKSPGRHSIGNGLLFVVRDSGRCSWLARVRTPEGKRQDIGLGPYPDVSLSEAKDKVGEYRRIAREGANPLDRKREVERVVPTFRQAAEQVYAERKGGFKNTIHRKQWIGTLREHAYPFIGEKPVDQVDGPQVIALLKPIWTRIPETARRVLQRTATVVAWAAAHGHRDHELPVTAIRMGLPPQPKKNRHHDAVPVEDAGKIYRSVAEGQGVSYACLCFLVLTAARSGEARGAKWDEIDFEKKVWTIPAERMKAGEAHAVPLSQPVIEILEAQPRIAPNEDFIFPGLREGKPIVDAALSKIMRGLHNSATVHGWRSTFRDWAAERTDYPGEVAEAALAHAISNKVEAAYRRTKYLERRRDMMTSWADYLHA